MKKFLLVAGTALLSVGVNAQIGINAGGKEDAPQYPEIAPDAIFQVANKKYESKGVLLPSVSLKSLTDQETITKGSASTVTKGLMVWNDGQDDLYEEGYYYWDGNRWNKMEGKTYTGHHGVEVTGTEIGLDNEIQVALNNAMDINPATIAVKANQMVPLKDITVGQNRRYITGMYGYLIKNDDGTWNYNGLCFPTMIGWKKENGFFYMNSAPLESPMRILVEHRNLPAWQAVVGIVSFWGHLQLYSPYTAEYVNFTNWSSDQTAQKKMSEIRENVYARRVHRDDRVRYNESRGDLFVQCKIPNLFLADE